MMKFNKNTENEKALIKSEKPLRKLKRKELLELLLTTAEENERLRNENEELRKKYDERISMIKDSGSIAEASLKITKIFEEAQKAADIYLESIKTEQTSNNKTYDEFDEPEKVINIEVVNKRKHG